MPQQSIPHKHCIDNADEYIVFRLDKLAEQHILHAAYGNIAVQHGPKVAALFCAFGVKQLCIRRKRAAVLILGSIIEIFEETMRLYLNVPQYAPVFVKRAVGEIYVPYFARKRPLNKLPRYFVKEHVRNLAAADVRFGKGYCGNAVQKRLHRSAHGAGIGNIKARIKARIYAGEHNVRLYGQERLYGRLYAVRRRAANYVSGFYVRGKIALFNAYLPRYGYLLGHAAALPGRRGHPNVAQPRGSVCQAQKPRRSYAVVVGNKYVKAKQSDYHIKFSMQF